MKHVLTSAGLLAIGAACVYAYDPELSRQQTGRPFSVAATVRGFYDDNINTSPDKIIVTTSRIDPGTGLPIKVSKDPRQESFGFQVSPSAHLNLPMEQTFVSLGYTYVLNWYENRDPNEIDQSHEFSAKLRHQFSPRHNIAVDDSFVVTSEPTVADRFGIVTAPTRTRGSVFQNRGSIDDTFQLTQLWGVSFGYANSWYDYEAEGVGSRSALLDRIEHLIRADGRYQFSPKLVGIVGYTFGFTTFTGDDEISPGVFAPDPLDPDPSNPTLPLVRVSPPVRSDDRNSYSHYGYVGADYDITAKLRASVRVGAQFSEYHRLDESSANPYADASLSYSIVPGTSLELGIRHTRSATDVAAVDVKTGKPTLDAEATAVWGQLQHRLMRNLTASLLGQYQHSVFNDGSNNGDSEDLFLVGVNFEYRFNRHFSAEVGYNYDQLESNLSIGSRSYERNRFYVGLRAAY
jgi:predicted porin